MTMALQQLIKNTQSLYPLIDNKMKLPKLYHYAISKNPYKLDFKAKINKNKQNNENLNDLSRQLVLQRSLRLIKHYQQMTQKRSSSVMKNNIPVKAIHENKIVQKKDKVLRLKNFIDDSCEKVLIPNIIELKDFIKNQKASYQRRMNVFLQKNGYDLLVNKKRAKTQSTRSFSNLVHERSYFLKRKRQNSSQLILKRIESGK